MLLYLDLLALSFKVHHNPGWIYGLLQSCLYLILRLPNETRAGGGERRRGLMSGEYATKLDDDSFADHRKWMFAPFS